MRGALLDVQSYDHFVQSAQNYRIFRREDLLSPADCRRLTYDLPADFVFHHVRKPIGELRARMAEKILKRLPGRSDVQSIVEEVVWLCEQFSYLTNVDQPIVSLRVVTPDYLARESPSVSQYFHRDSTALTITKVFYGDGAMYVENEDVNRSFFDEQSIQQPETADEEVVAPAGIKTVPQGAVLLLKGEVYPEIDKRSRAVIDLFVPPGEIKSFNKGNGFIHKGGGFSQGDRRLVFTCSVYT